MALITVPARMEKGLVDLVVNTDQIVWAFKTLGQPLQIVLPTGVVVVDPSWIGKLDFPEFNTPEGVPAWINPKQVLFVAGQDIAMLAPPPLNQVFVTDTNIAEKLEGKSVIVRSD